MADYFNNNISIDFQSIIKSGYYTVVFILLECNII